jgi:hypothetical protein
MSHDDPFNRLDIAVRGYLEPAEPLGKRGRRKKSKEVEAIDAMLATRLTQNHRPVLLVDFETSRAGQRLLHGANRYCQWIDSRLVCMEEALIYAEDLPEHDKQTIFAYHLARKHQTGAANVLGAVPTLGVISDR